MGQMHRFFVPQDQIDGKNVTLTGDVAHQLARVLRARPGEEIVVLDGSGWEYLVTLEDISPREVRGRLSERRPSRGEPETKVTLYQGVLRSDRFEFVLQKGTELGVSAFVPVFCERSVSQDTGPEWATGRYARWRKILSEAAEQSNRGRVPALEPHLEFPDACQAARGLSLIPWENEDTTGLKTALERLDSEVSPTPDVSVFIGPEGGFTEREVERARDRGIVPVSLGARVLRAETAAIATATVIMYELGELGL